MCMNEDIDWDNGVLPESQQYSFVVPTVAIDPLHPVSELAALPRRCKVHTKRMCLAAAARLRNSCVVPQGAKVSDALMVLRHGAHVRRQMPRGDRERRCGAEGNRRFKQDNCSVRDSVVAGAFALINSRKDGARAIGVKPATFFRWRFFTADGIATHDSVFMHDLAGTFEVEPPCIVVIFSVRWRRRK